MPDIDIEFLKIITIALISFSASFLSFFSGFGLGTILLPVFAFFYELPIAIALTGVVHFFNNLFKLALTYKSARIDIIVKFGLSSIAGALLGAFILQWANNNFNPIQIPYLNRSNEILKITIGFLIIVFATIEYSKNIISENTQNNWLIPGGIISGFFGGLSGHQGALRTLFIQKIINDKNTFIATGIVIACMVDIARIPIYLVNIKDVNLDYIILSISLIAAMAGALIGKSKSKNISEHSFKKLIYYCLLAIGIMMTLGFI
ncbi:MAG: sulfite exporter TauE/SafE family protein [Saprospiraceae bacterium]|nr:sulfite exporter TauE/SafE family protein [Saprospiraceae bacterium]